MLWSSTRNKMCRGGGGGGGGNLNLQQLGSHLPPGGVQNEKPELSVVLSGVKAWLASAVTEEQPWWSREAAGFLETIKTTGEHKILPKMLGLHFGNNTFKKKTINYL